MNPSVFVTSWSLAERLDVIAALAYLINDSSRSKDSRFVRDISERIHVVATRSEDYLSRYEARIFGSEIDNIASPQIKELV